MIILNIINGRRTGGPDCYPPTSFIHLGGFHMGTSEGSPCPHHSHPFSLGNAPGEGIRRGRQLLSEGMMMRANGIRLLHIRDVPMPPHQPPRTLQGSSRRVASSARALQPRGNARVMLHDASIPGDADARLSPGPNRAGEGGLVMSQRNLRPWKADRRPLPATHCKSGGRSASRKHAHCSPEPLRTSARL